MSASFSPVKSSKPLNPSAMSYEPQRIPPIAEPIYPPHRLPFESHHLYATPSLLQQVSEPQSGLFLPVLMSPEFCPHPSFRYCSPGSWDNKGQFLDLYNPEKQPQPWVQVFNSPNSIQHNGISCRSEINVEKKKKGKWGFIPPRLKPPRECPMHSQGVWVKKAEAEKSKARSDFPSLPPASDEELIKLDGKTSLMIKNVPNHLKRSGLQCMLDNHCRTENRNRKAQPGSSFCKSEYDFLYLPMDFGFHLNLGFAFVNFTSPIAALRFYRAFNNREWGCGDSRKKICEIAIAKFQGKDALKEQFHRSSFPCHTDAYLPVVFSCPRDGINRTKPTLVGRRTHVSLTPKDRKVMIMTKRKNKKA